MIQMKIAVVLVITFVSFGVSTATFSGTLGFTSNNIVSKCNGLSSYPSVLASYDVFGDGGPCGQYVTITCLDSNCCDTSMQYTAQIANLCNGCDVTFKLSTGDFNNIDVNGCATALDIEYDM